MYRPLPVILIPLLVTACAIPQREEPPAPIVESGRPAQPATSVSDAAPAPAAKPESKPAKPRPTTVYAYTPPESIPDPVPEPVAESTSGAPPTVSQPQSADAAQPAASEAPKAASAQSATPPQAAPAKPKPKPKPQTVAKPPAEVAQQPKPVTPPPAPVASAPVPTSAPPPPAAPPAPEVAAAPPLSALAPAGMPPAVNSLASRAEQQRQTGDYAGAAATLERALRIEPQEAYLWNRLARVRLEQGLGSQAGNLAARSNALAGDQAKLKQNNWDVIATVRRQSGDVPGALEAESLAGDG